jgi:isocitrate dehydrogenase
VELVFTPQGGGEKQRMEVYDFKGPGVSIGMFNTDESIEAFAHSSLQVKQKGYIN